MTTAYREASVSLLMVLVFLAFTLCLIPGGIVSSKLGTRRAVLVSGLLMSAGVLAPLTTDIATLLPLRMTFGIGGAILLPATASIIVEWFRPTERGVMNALMLAAQGTGVALRHVPERAAGGGAGSGESCS